jgi:uncharacterized protein YwgA
MMDLTDNVAALIRLNGGQIVGKTRLQKIVYLLEEAKLGFGLSFDYHNYGPYSADLSFATDDVVSLNYVKVEERYGFHSVPYTVFRATSDAPEFPDDPLKHKRKAALTIMENYSALVLELAATALYLSRHGYGADAWKEVKRRKSSKAVAPIVEKAKHLLGELKLA